MGFAAAVHPVPPSGRGIAACCLLHAAGLVYRLWVEPRWLQAPRTRCIDNAVPDQLRGKAQQHYARQIGCESALAQ